MPDDKRIMLERASARDGLLTSLDIKLESMMSGLDPFNRFQAQRLQACVEIRDWAREQR